MGLVYEDTLRLNEPSLIAMFKPRPLQFCKDKAIFFDTGKTKRHNMTPIILRLSSVSLPAKYPKKNKDSL